MIKHFHSGTVFCIDMNARLTKRTHCPSVLSQPINSVPRRRKLSYSRGFNFGPDLAKGYISEQFCSFVELQLKWRQRTRKGRRLKTTDSLGRLRGFKFSAALMHRLPCVEGATSGAHPACLLGALSAPSCSNYTSPGTLSPRGDEIGNV